MNSNNDDKKSINVTPSTEFPTTSYLESRKEGELQTEFTEADVEALFTPTNSSIPNNIPLNPLSKPVCLPQINASFDSPILRAYPPSLKDVGISEEDWLAFCDGLNIALVASPPLQVVDIVGTVIKFIPWHWAILAGVLIQTAAQTSIHILSKTLTDKYLLHANETFFKPRGITIRLIRTPALRQLLEIDPTATPPSRFVSAGNKVLSVAEKVALHLPIVRKVVIAFANPVPVVDVDSDLGMTERRLEMMGGKIADLELDVPKAKTPEALMDKTSALSVKLRKWNTGRKETAANRERAQLANAQGLNGNSSRYVSPRQGIISTPISMARNYVQGQSSNYRSQSNLEQDQSEGKVVERERSNRKTHRSGRKTRMRQLEMKVKIEDRKEWKQTNSLIWLCVLNNEEDSKIVGREVADSSADLEINHEEWEEEIEIEAEEEDSDYFEGEQERN